MTPTFPNGKLFRIVNKTGFTGDIDVIPVAKITINGSGVITQNVDARKNFFSANQDIVTPLGEFDLTEPFPVEGAFDFGSPRNDRSIKSLRNWIRAVMTRIAEIEGVPFGDWILSNNSLANLQTQITAILNDTAKEETFIAGSGGQTIFVATTIAWINNDAIPDIQVYLQDRRMVQGIHFNKLSDTEIEFLFTVPEDSLVLIRDERTGGGGGGTDLENITVNPQPSVAAGQTVGTIVRPWSSVFLKDKITTQVYELEVVNGTFAVTLVP